MRPVHWLTALLAGGCGFNVPGGTPPEDSAVTADSPPLDPDAAIDAPMIDAPIDGPPLAACPAAPTGCTQFTCSPTACHYVCNDKREWTIARDRCVSLGLGCIATINSAAENTCIATATNPNFQAQTYVWSGFVQAASGSEPGGGWAWQCGTSSFLAGNWGSFEPNNTGGNEDCGLMIEGGAWIDGNCATSGRYVCEFPR